MNLPKIAIVGGNLKFVQSIQQYLIHYGELLHFKQVSDNEIKQCTIALICHKPSKSDGLESLMRLKQYHPSIRVVMLGWKVSQHDIVEAFRLGAKDFLFAPFMKETLLNCLHQFNQPLDDTLSSKWWEKYLPKYLYTEPEVALGIVDPSLVKILNNHQSMTSESNLQVQMLGDFSANLDGKLLSKFPSKKALSVLAYIFYKHPRMVHRDVLIDKFWRDSPSSSARNCLNVTIHAIRKSLSEIREEGNLLVFKNECYGIDPDVEVKRDFDLFESYWETGRRLELDHKNEAAIDIYQQAFRFYQGDFMESLLYEEWVERARDQLKETWLVILDRLSAHLFNQKEYQRCINLCQKMLEKDACLEGVHQRIMSCYLNLGMKDMAVRQFMKCKEGLKKMLNISPGNATIQLYQKILAA